MTNRARRRALAAAVLAALLLPAGAAVAQPSEPGGPGTPPGQARAAAARAAAAERAANRVAQGPEADDDGDDQGGRPAVPPGQLKKAERAAQAPGVPPGWARAAAARAGRPITVTGTVTTAGDSLVVTVRGGHPVARLWAYSEGGTPEVPGAVTIVLGEDARVRVNGVEGTLGDVAEGDHVSARGLFDDGTLTASRLNAATPDADDPDDDD
jgi:hypothetical protein